MTTLLTLLCLAGSPLFAEDKVPELVVTQKTAPSAEGLIPQGWTLEFLTEGDLDGDGKPDSVLELVGPDALARGLIVAFKRGEGYESGGASSLVLICPQCGGTLGRPVNQASAVKLEKDVLILQETLGSREMTEALLRFRYEPKAKRMRLIGRDDTETDRLRGRRQRTSTNYLTGTRVIERERMGGDGTEWKKAGTQTLKLKQAPIFLETAKI